MENLTPAQEARRVADQYGFKIIAHGRRYDITRDGALVGNVGGYRAAINLMHRRATVKKPADITDIADERLPIFVRVKQPPPATHLLRLRWPDRSYVNAPYASRKLALKAARRMMSGTSPADRPSFITIERI